MQQHSAVRNPARGGVQPRDESVLTSQEPETVPLSEASKVAVEDEPGLGLEQADTSRVLGSAIKALPGQERLAFGLVYSENVPLDNVAFVLGVTVPRLGEVLEGALRHLRAELAAEVG